MLVSSTHNTQQITQLHILISSWRRRIRTALWNWMSCEQTWIIVGQRLQKQFQGPRNTSSWLNIGPCQSSRRLVLSSRRSRFDPSAFPWPVTCTDSPYDMSFSRNLGSPLTIINPKMLHSHSNNRKFNRYIVPANQENNKEDRQCTYDVTLRRVRATIVAVEKQYVLHILSVSL